MKYKSTLFDEARNKIGSIVASKNRNGNYFRDRVTPHNPKTTRQSQIRSQFTFLSQNWKALTETERAGWIALAAQVTLKDTLGNSYKPSGQQLYVGNNSNLANAGEARIDTAPAVPDTLPDLTALDITASVETASPFTQILTVDVTGGTSGDELIINATAQYSAGRNFVGRSQYRLVTGSNLPLGSPVNALTAYQALFGNLIVGSKLSISVVGITANGFATQPLRADIIVVAA